MAENTLGKFGTNVPVVVPVLGYLARYTHRVALSNDRIVKLDGDQVTIRYRDSSDNNKMKLMTLNAFEFIHRFLLHVLPDGFMKIRHYGILSNRSRKTKLRRCKELLGISQDQDTDKPERRRNNGVVS